MQLQISTKLFLVLLMYTKYNGAQFGVAISNPHFETEILHKKCQTTRPRKLAG